jgi:hypothetical protein
MLASVAAFQVFATEDYLDLETVEAGVFSESRFTVESGHPGFIVSLDLRPTFAAGYQRFMGRGSAVSFTLILALTAAQWRLDIDRQ